MVEMGKLGRNQVVGENPGLNEYWKHASEFFVSKLVVELVTSPDFMARDDRISTVTQLPIKVDSRVFIETSPHSIVRVADSLREGFRKR